ncbi:MAG: cyclopropane-fatty-acyl-phospholipid synthase [Parcubacteria group bacterium Athens1014_10]|nr:MAG: cyclopropane-fatty-acyl-phospholipid synthase [Parcubacteria group bacterium Athens1014_10]
MKKDKFKKILKEILSSAGIKINGRNPWDIKVRHEKFYQRVLVQGSLGLGESYMDKWWDCQKIDQLFERIFIFQLEDKIKKNWALIFELLIAKIFNRQSKKRAFQVGEKHYNLGNELYENMLDKRMVYTCAYWKEARNLDHAQENKLDLVCRKLGLREGMKILDIGCGWGSFAKYAAEKYKVEVVGVTVSEEQVKLGKKLCRGLPVEIRLQDYRDINDKFDHVVSLGMFEHVGCKNYRIYKIKKFWRGMGG